MICCNCDHPLSCDRCGVELPDDMGLGWQPIETAPRDGTDIIVYRPKFDGDYIPRVGTDYWMTKGVLTPTWAKSRKDCPPTHWQNFPSPPVEQAKTEVEG